MAYDNFSSNYMKEYVHYSDEQLLDLVRWRDEKAFTVIYERHWGWVYAQIYKMLHDEEEAKDGTQEVFSKLWIKAPQFKSSQNLKGLLFRSARNLVFNLFEKNRVRQEHMESLLSFVNTVDPNTVNRVDEKALEALIELEIQKLPPKMRQVFELSRKEELSHQEIAQRLDISYQTVKKQVQKALKIIKPKINHFGITLFFFFFL